MSNKITFDIRSHEGVGPIRFGMTPGEVRSVLGKEFTSFKRNQQDTYPCDYFEDLQCFVYYDENQRAEAVEFAETADPVLNGVHLLRLGFADLILQIAKMDPNVLIESDGFTSGNLGVGSWAPNTANEPQSPPESIIVFARGYYD